MPTKNWGQLAAPYTELFRSLQDGVLGVEMQAPGTPQDAAAPGVLARLDDGSGGSLGALKFTLAPGVDAANCLARLRPAIDCLAVALAAAEASQRAQEVKLLRLAHELDLDFPDDAQLDKALAAVARRTGVALAWLSSPRGLITLCARGHDQELDPGVMAELKGMRERVAPLSDKVQRPLIINGTSWREEHSAQCRLLLVPLSVGRSRHRAWLVLANPLSSAAFGGWQVLAALTLGNALARRLEVDLDRRTGLFNRGGLESALPRLRHQQGSLLVLDIDRLQSINQVHGMAAGDGAIQALARMLCAPLLPEDALVGRTHGDQFAVVLPRCDASRAVLLGETIRKAARAIQPGLPDDPSPLTLSGGIVEVDDFRKPFDRFAIDADTALKLAKDRGRSRIEMFTSSSSTLIRRSDEVVAAADLREALRRGALPLYAQPIQLLSDRDAAPGFELLVRLRDEESGEILPPGEYISAAQRFQMLPELDRYVVDKAFETLAPHWGLLARHGSSVSINVSGQSLADEDFVSHFIERLRASRLPPRLIIVEVTEQAALIDLERAGSMMHKLRQVGCGIAIDDFGTGANSLAYLRTLPVTRLKIDGSFIRDLLSNRRSEAGLKGIMELAREYDLDTVAEYVETEAVAHRLRMMGVQRGQGYLFGKPEPIEDALRKLNDDLDTDLDALLAG